MEKKFEYMKMAALGMILLALTACTTVPEKTYAGPALPADETATLVSGPYTDIVSVDGQPVHSLNVAVTPGAHTVVLKPDDQTSYREYIFYSWVKGSVTFTAQAGRKYLAYVDFITSKAPAEESGTGFVWIGYVQDRSSGVRLAKTDELPLGAERRGYPGGSFSFPFM